MRLAALMSLVRAGAIFLPAKRSLCCSYVLSQQGKPAFAETESETKSAARRSRENALIFFRDDQVLTEIPKLKNNENESDRKRGLSVLGVDERLVGWQLQHCKFSELPTQYARLTKARLTALVVVTAIGGYAMAATPLHLGTLSACVVGTGLLSACANSFNQFLEVPYDSQMKRTQARPLVTGKLTPLHCVAVGVACGLSGFGILLCGANSLTATLGLSNVFLYAGVYTPMKRYSVGCTWLGAVVGAIPPLMGWAACAGGLDWSAMVLAAVLYAWQFPHFNSLSWNLRPEYSRAGYHVMCVTDPGLCRRTTLRYSLSLVPLCSLAAPLSGLTVWSFALTSLPLNLYLVLLAYRFYQKPDSKTSRKLFRYSLVYLPAVMLLMLISKEHFIMFSKIDSSVISENQR